MGIFYYFLIVGTLSCVAAAGDYIPRSFYILSPEGQVLERHPLRNKRDLESLLRIRRGAGYSSSMPTSQSGAQASSSSFASASGGGTAQSFSSSSSGTGGDGQFAFPDNFFTNFDPSNFNFIPFGPNGFDGQFGGNFGPPQGFGAGMPPQAAAGMPQGHAGSTGSAGAPPNNGYNGPVLFSRMGEEEGTGVQVSGSAAGPHGAFSQTSSSVGSDGKVKYSVKSGKY